MKTADLFKNKTVLSFEVFPPKKTSPVETIYATLDELRDLKPDFISVTYSASGNANKDATLAIASKIKNELHLEAVAHLTCLHQTKEEVRALLEQFKEHNIENILALLGDPIPGTPSKADFKHASDLVSFIKQNGDFNVLAACYPEGHIGAESLEADLRNLKIKVDSGTDHLVTQLFFDNPLFYSFLERARNIGIGVPIEAGIMPVVNKAQVERIVSLCGVNLPKKFTAMMDRFENNPIAMRDAGIAYAVDQIVDLISQGVDGIHLYTMNNAYVARKISEAVSSLVIARD
jgi:methylenetetrahydrofolate reductase (NADPH)